MYKIRYSSIAVWSLAREVGHFKTSLCGQGIISSHTFCVRDEEKGGEYIDI